MEQYSSVLVELARGEKDWLLVRDCFVSAFHGYPLYTFLIPDEKNRPRFLRQYLEAIYDVTVRNGPALLLAVTTYKDNTEEDSKDIGQQRTVIGGVLFVPASEKGGWVCANDADFIDAYKRYNLTKLDAEAMEKLARYEEWEYETITKHVVKSGIPMWNGAFCAIDPSFAGQGFGSLSYTDCISVLMEAQTKTSGRITSQKTTKTGPARRFLKMLSTAKSPEVKSKCLVKSGRSPNVVRGLERQKTPFVLALTHGDQAAKFHKKNGFQSAVKTPYQTAEKEKAPFDVHVLIMDPFKTRKMDDCIASLQENFNVEIQTNISNGKAVEFFVDGKFK